MPFFKKMPNKHTFHIVDNSPWPIINSFNLMNLLLNLLFLFKSNNFKLYFSLLTSLIILLMSMYNWWRDIIRESHLQGHHTHRVYKGLKMGMMLFILSEVMFFFSFFWSFFHFSLAPEMEIGNTWPPNSINMLNPFHIPILNTTILLTSGISVTWAHNCILNSKYSSSSSSIFITIFLGCFFSMIQSIEYYSADFSINDSVFGSTFFILTGFHGLHVLIGTLFLTVSLMRILYSHFNSNHHFGFEASAWYWHFVDVVWIYLFIFIYWWFW
uniref:Cytochrome c oxidase subunit 3 n=1 Tax=Amblyseiulella paraheveae TaxID=3049516 RepID=A0AAU6PBE5_9ACAR